MTDKVEIPEGLLVEWNIEMDKNGQKIITIEAIDGNNKEKYEKYNLKPDGYTNEVFLIDHESENDTSYNNYLIRTTNRGAYNVENIGHSNERYEPISRITIKGTYTKEEAIEKINDTIEEIKEARSLLKKDKYENKGIEKVVI